jgi:hypothetical protein
METYLYRNKKQTGVTHPSQTLSNEAYLDGLRTADPEVLADLYAEFRPAILRAVSQAGGGNADGPVFYQLALLEVSRQADQETFPTATPLLFQLTDLAVAHYRDWMAERGQTPEAAVEQSADQESPGAPETPDDMALEEFPSVVPPSEILRETRQKVFAWKRLEQLYPDCRTSIMEPEDAGGSDRDRRDRCLNQWRLLLGPAAAAEGDEQLPAWAAAARADAAGYALWRQLRGFEARIGAGEPLRGEAGRRFPTAILLLIGALVLVAAGLAYRYYQSGTPAEVYRDNFQPPASILADRESRLAAAPADSTVVQPPPECDPMFAEADRFFSKKDFEGAIEPLVYMLEQGPPECHSDALFYLGIVGLQTDNPALALDCFSKIENLDRFGEDVYWYQALTFVKLAEANPMLEEKARRAVERAISNTRSDDRRRQAEEMLQNLSK